MLTVIKPRLSHLACALLKNFVIFDTSRQNSCNTVAHFLEFVKHCPPPAGGVLVCRRPQAAFSLRAGRGVKRRRLRRHSPAREERGRAAGGGSAGNGRNSKRRLHRGDSVAAVPYLAGVGGEARAGAALPREGKGKAAERCASTLAPRGMLARLEGCRRPSDGRRPKLFSAQGRKTLPAVAQLQSPQICRDYRRLRRAG